MEFYRSDFDRDYSDLDPDLIACVADWFIDRFDADLHFIENPLAEIIDDSIPFILDDLRNQRPGALTQAAVEFTNIFPEGLRFLMDNDAIYPFYQISVPAIDSMTGLVIRRQSSLGMLISPADVPFAIKVETAIETSTSSSARYRTSVEIIDRYYADNCVEIAFFDSNETLGVETVLQGSDERLRCFCMYSALKIGDLGLLNAYDSIHRPANSFLKSVTSWFR